LTELYGRITQRNVTKIFYARRGSNPQPSVPKTDALPLSHQRLLIGQVKVRYINTILFSKEQI
jgi:hypothetical protein